MLFLALDPDADVHGSSSLMAQEDGDGNWRVLIGLSGSIAIMEDHNQVAKLSSPLCTIATLTCRDWRFSNLNSFTWTQLARPWIEVLTSQFHKPLDMKPDRIVVLHVYELVQVLPVSTSVQAWMHLGLHTIELATALHPVHYWELHSRQWTFCQVCIGLNSRGSTGLMVIRVMMGLLSCIYFLKKLSCIYLFEQIQYNTSKHATHCPYVSSFLSSPTRETQWCNLIFIWKCIEDTQSSEKGPFTRISPFN